MEGEVWWTLVSSYQGIPVEVVPMEVLPLDVDVVAYQVVNDVMVVVR